MDLVNQDHLRTLLGEHEKPCISIFIPTVRAGAETQQNPIRLKNMLQQSEDKLRSGGVSAAETQKLIEHGLNIVTDSGFWQRQSEGLAVFISPDAQYTFRVPVKFKELVAVNDKFMIKPLLPLLNNDGRFYLLALSQNQVRFFQGTRYTIDLIDVPDLPESLEDALWYEDDEKQLQMHSAGGPSTGGQRMPAIYHGNAAGSDDANQKQAIERFFRHVEQALRPLLENERAPLVLAGVEYLHPIYLSVNKYQHIEDQGIHGNPEDAGLRELHAEAWKIVEPVFRQEQQKAAELFHQQSGMDTGRASTDIREIVPAAYAGRVGQLFVPMNEETWGHFDTESFEVELHEDSTLENTDLLDFAATQTILNGGVVYTTQPEQAADPAQAQLKLAAVFRY